ncbi:tetracycline resistance protein [Ktedonobacter sp. SOSP1-52]|uniref:elongation factor G n=1 Tax=Ktedonobacter sp. SOSP1-52 TaxID=2778366 RepID=UPI00191651E7|nr:TetM/TetW/TetO/TetS family tetracycline resistance ribosomal protection protein [Ktedonobacter sp. SOSP1-52]GHO62367.1 tetracycline resistance protein [Ktedonobacter sp. SOSP1-52]
MTTVNIGIVAHVDAGKTSLTERILFETHVIDAIGRVDQGNTQTDSLDLEKRRGITIKASVVSFSIQDKTLDKTLKINLIDTPGHADFIAEVERSFSVLDAAILVISAVEGIQAQTKFLMSLLTRLGIPTIIFINKIDRSGAQSHTLVKHIKEKLAESVLPLYTPENLGTKQAFIVENSFSHAKNPAFMEECIGLLALNDEAFLEAYVNEEQVAEEQVKEALQRQVRDARLYPIFFGSAMTGIGVSELLTGIATFFSENPRSEDGPLSGVVFKIEKEASGEKIAYVRVFSGNMHVREYVPVSRKISESEVETHTDKVKKLHVFWEGKTLQSSSVEAGEFCKVWGLKDIKIGDVVGERSDSIKDLHFVAPQMEARIEARHQEQSHQLYQALLELSEEDPLVKVLQDTFHHEIYLRLFGEVQKEVIETMLQEKYGLDVQFSETRVVCIEKPAGTGQSLEEMGKGGNPFYATVGFRIEPAPPGSGISYRLEVKLGALPLAFHRAIEETVYETLQQGLYGWEVTDIVVVVTHTGYSSPVSTAADFRNLVPLVVMEALSQAGTGVYEPLNQFELSAPAHAISQALFRLSALKASVERPILRGDTFLLTGTLPMATTEEFKRSLHSFTEGEGIFLTRPSGFRKIEDAFPTRKRADFNPLNRKDYMLHILHTY